MAPKQMVLGPKTFLGMVILLGMFGPISTDMYLPALPDMASDLSTDAASLNATLYGFIFGMAVSMLLVGPLSDRHGRKKPLIVCLSMHAAASITCGLTGDVWSLIIFRVIQSIGAGASITMSAAFIKDSYEGSVRVRVLNMNAVFRALGPMLSPIVGAAIISVSGWRTTFYVTAVASLICLALAFLTTETLPEENRKGKGFKDVAIGTKSILSDRSLMIFMVMSSMMSFAFMGYLSVSSYIYEGMFGFAESEYSLALASAMLIGSFGMICINRATKDVPNYKRIPLYTALETIPGILIILFGDQSWWVFFLLFLPFVVGLASMSPWGMAAMMASHEGDNGVLSGLINFVYFTIGCIGMIASTLPFPSYTVALGSLMAIGGITFCVLWGIIKAGGGSLKGLEMTGSGRMPDDGPNN